MLFPWVGICVLATSSLLNPSYEEFVFFEQTSMRKIPHVEWIPSSAKPAETLSQLVLYSMLYLSALNLLTLRLRRTIRLILICLLINGVVLAVFGTLQKLVGSEIFFGLQKSPNPKFFATFIYHNHWGAFAIQLAAIGFGLSTHYYKSLKNMPLMRSYVPALLTAVLFLLVSIPLSASRSSTLFAMILVGIGLVYLLRLIFRATRQAPRERLKALVWIGVILILSVAGIYRIAKPVIDERIADTIQQLKKEEHYAFVESQQIFYVDSRFRLYRDTLEMIEEKPVWGWGLGSYEFVFQQFNTQSNAASRWFSIYRDAHSDWLELLAELGIVGLLLVVAMFAPLLFVSPLRFLFRSNQGFLMLGALLMCGYALIEFPFVNPAVAITFLILYFSAVRLAHLDHVNYAPERSTPESSQRLPAH
ncbi:MAG: hypothetical protein SynsKO_39430 [Synoicihabitans sp.]